MALAGFTPAPLIGPLQSSSTSRPKVIQLAETVTTTRGASVEIITETLGDPGRAR